MVQFTIEDIQKFLRRFEYQPATGCIEWTGPLTNGYGHTSYKGIKGTAHRIMYQMYHGVLLPPGKQTPVDHLCRNRKCANPAHLEAVTLKTNLLRGNTIAASNAAKTRCPQGHEYDGRNTRGNRICKTCMKQRKV